MVHGIRAAMADLLDDDETIDDRDRVFISLSSDRLNNACHFQGSTAREWRQNGVHAAEILDQLARTLNSKEQFEMNDSFQLAFVHVRRPPVGTGPKKYLPGHQSSQRFKQMKQSWVAMPQDDAQLCTARAIVMARGVHQAGDNRNERQKWTSRRQCVRRRDRAARALLGEVGLRPGPYEPEERTLLATAPSRYDYKVRNFLPSIGFLSSGHLRIRFIFFFSDHRGRRQPGSRLFRLRSWRCSPGFTARGRSL